VVGVNRVWGLNHCFRLKRKHIFATGINDFLSADRGEAIAETAGINGGNNGRNKGDPGTLMLLCSDL
jgi:hypothetical protein